MARPIRGWINALTCRGCRTGRVPLQDFSYALHRLHIDMTQKQFTALMKKIGANSQEVDWRRFLRFFQKAT